MDEIERIARAFHEAYEDMAPSFGWTTQTPVPFDQLPESNKQLMLAVITELISQQVIVSGDRHGAFTDG